MCMKKSTLLSKAITSEIANLLRIYPYFKTVRRVMHKLECALELGNTKLLHPKEDSI